MNQSLRDDLVRHVARLIPVIIDTVNSQMEIDKQSENIDAAPVNTEVEEEVAESKEKETEDVGSDNVRVVVVEAAAKKSMVPPPIKPLRSLLLLLLLL